MKKIKVMVADDHSIVRMGLTALLEAERDMQVVGEAEDGEQAVAMALKALPDVIVMDLMMPVKDGIDATREIHQLLPQVKILVLTTSGSSDDIASAIKAGAAGALLKSSSNDRLIAAIRHIADGKMCISDEVREMIDEDPPIETLTARQQEILCSITRGLTNLDIAKQLGIREDSVKEHVNNIFLKIGAANRAEAVAIALRKHLLKF